MERCYAWFLGGNDVGVPVADPARGAGFDGLDADRRQPEPGRRVDADVAGGARAHPPARAAAAARAAGVARPVAVGPGEPPDTDWPAPRTTTVVGSMRQRSAASMARSNSMATPPPDVDAVTRPDDAMLFRRSAANPILTVADVPYPANSVFNPGAARVGDETILLVRVEDLRGISQLHVVRSADGVTGWTFDPSRCSAPTSRTTPRRSGAARTRG